MMDWPKYVENLMQENNRLWQNYVAVNMENVMLKEKVNMLIEYIKGLKNNRGNLGGNADGRQCI